MRNSLRRISRMEQRELRHHPNRLRALCLAPAIVGLLATALPLGAQYGGVTSAYRGAAPTDGSGSLAQSFSVTLRGGVTSSGVGLRSVGSGSITVAGIPMGASVHRAFLYWVTIGTSGTFTSPTLDGNPVAGALIGSAGDTCWGAAGNFAYRADVTSLVTGNGSYTIAGLPASSPSVDDSQGAALVVIYSDPAGAYRQIVIEDGAITLLGTFASNPLTGFAPDVPLTNARLTYLVGDGQNVGAQPQLNGNVLAANPFTSAEGLYWDTPTFDVTSLSPTSPSTVAINSPGDCLIWAGVVYSTTTGVTCGTWGSLVGTWGPSGPLCGDITSSAVTTTYESEALPASYGDFTYEARIIATRPNQPSAANTLFVRGTPAPLQTSAQRWNTGIAFNFSTNGKFSVFRYSGGTTTPLQSWVTPVGTTINGSGLPNTLRVVANGGTLTFSINGVAVKTITGETLLSGQVGVGMVRSIPTTAGPNDTLVVDSAIVTTGTLSRPGGMGPGGDLMSSETRISTMQEKANLEANRRNPNPDPLFDRDRK